MKLLDKIKIVCANKEDIPGIAKVLEGTLRQDFVYGKNSFDENVFYSFSRSINHKNEGVYVVKEGKEVVGFSWFMNHPPNNGTSILEMFAVRKDKQSRGIGSRLIAETSDMFVDNQRKQGIDLRTLHLTTNLSNKRAQTIYERAGYKIVGEIPGFVGDGNVEVVMLKKVSDAPCQEKYKSTPKENN